MANTTSSTRVGPVERRVGYALGIVANGVLLYVVNVWPSWRAVPFLTEAAVDVLVIVNVSLIAGIVLNTVYLFIDLPWLKALGDLVTLAIGLAVVVRVLQVFPFDFPPPDVGWATLTRFILGLAIIGSVVGLIVQVVVLIRRILGYGVEPR